MFIVTGVLFFPLWGLGSGASKAGALDGDKEHAVPNRPLCIQIASSEHEHRTLALEARATSRLVPWNPGRGHPGLGLRTGQKHHSPASCWPWLPGQKYYVHARPLQSDRFGTAPSPKRPLWNGMLLITIQSGRFGSSRPLPWKPGPHLDLCPGIQVKDIQV